MSQNPSAFPHRDPELTFDRPGMGQREYFAGQALVGLLSGQYRDTGVYNHTELVAESFLIADAMLAARSQASSS